MGQIAAGTGLVQQVDGLVGQVAVGDIPLTQGHSGVQHIGRHLHMVVLLVVVLDAAHHGQRISNAGFLHPHGLEPALQRLVLLDILAVLVEGGGTDDLDLAAGQGGLEDVGSVHRAFGITRADEIVDLVDDKDDIAELFDLLDEALHAAFKLAPELGPGHQGRQVQQEHFLIPEFEGHVPGGNTLGQSFGDGGLANARLADQAGVIFLAPVQNLNDPLGLHIPADDLIQLPASGPAGQVHAVGVQEFPWWADCCRCQKAGSAAGTLQSGHHSPRPRFPRSGQRWNSFRR